MKMQFIHDDGGRTLAGYKGNAGDCVARAIAIAAGLPYSQIYDALSAGNASERRTRGKTSGQHTARRGIHVARKWFKQYMAALGFVWVPTMAIGTGCRVHLHDGELPAGRLVVSLSKHYTAVIDGVIHDIYDPRREVHCSRSDDGTTKPGEWRNGNGMVHSVSRRCVYGYWKLNPSIP